MTREPIQTESATLTMLGEDLLEMRVKDNISVDLDMVKTDIEAGRKIAGVTKLRVLNVPGNYSTIEPAAREYAIKNMEWASAVAFVSKSLAQRLIINHFVRRMQKDMPIRAFREREKALGWLENGALPKLQVFD